MFTSNKYELSCSSECNQNTFQASAVTRTQLKCEWRTCNRS